MSPNKYEMTIKLCHQNQQIKHKSKKARKENLTLVFSSTINYKKNRQTVLYNLEVHWIT